MLPKRRRLTKQFIEGNLLKAPRLKNSNFTLIYKVISDIKYPAVSVSVSKKTAPRAVARNKIRRRAYSALTPIIPFLAPGFSALILYTSKDFKTPISELTKDFETAFRQIKAINK
jgi:ribonuclease P protein component